MLNLDAGGEMFSFLADLTRVGWERNWRGVALALLAAPAFSLLLLLATWLLPARAGCWL